MSHLWLPPPPALDLRGAEVHLWRGSLTQPAHRVAAMARLLAPDERERAGRFHTAQLRDRFIVGRGTLRTLLGAYLAVAPETVRLGYSAHGKPFLAHPLCRPGLEFNLAHAEDRLLLAFTRTHPLGVDIEPTQARRNLDVLELSERFFAPDEHAALLRLPAEMRHSAFFHIWTCKEAFIKACGQGLSLPLASFSISMPPGEAPHILRIADDPAGADQWTLCAYEPVPGYAAALAIRSREIELRCFEARHVDLESTWGALPLP